MNILNFKKKPANKIDEVIASIKEINTEIARLKLKMVIHENHLELFLDEDRMVYNDNGEIVAMKEIGIRNNFNKKAFLADNPDLSELYDSYASQSVVNKPWRIL